MRPIFISLTAILLLLLFFFSTCIPKNNTKYTNDKEVYKEFCSGCHGENVEDFNNIKWKYGITEAEITKSIEEGYPNFGMPSFKKGLTKKQISELTSLMIEALENKNNIILEDKQSSSIYTSNNQKVRIDTIATGFDSPWGFAQIANNSYLITDREGVLYKVDDKQNKISIKNTPDVLAKGQGGLLDVATHPKYEENGWVYLSYSKYKEEDGETKTTTAIVRGKIINNSWEQNQEIFEALPYTTTKHHYGSRIIFDHQGYLYFSVGERGKHFEFPQSVENDNGKIHRLKDDGTIPTDNPFVADNKASKSIYSYGHRNPQGLIYNTETNEIWENEHGPKGGDEINVIKKGVNYGWPVISYGINYDGTQLTNLREKNGMEQPVWYWVPSIAPSGMCFVTGNKYKAWKGDLLIGSLKFNYLNRCIIKDGKIIGEEKLLKNIGRMRNVQMGTDGYIYIGVEKPGMVLRLLPIDN